MTQKLLRLYQNVQLNKDAEYLFSSMAAHYVIHVMRLKPHDDFLIFNGVDGEWRAKVVNITKKNASFIVQDQQRLQTIDPQRSLIFSPLKSHRLHFLVEKAVELGVTDFHPVMTQHSSIHTINEVKFQAHSIEAAEQCERLCLPKIHSIMPLAKTVDYMLLMGYKIFIGDERRSAPSLMDSCQAHLKENLHDRHIAILIGPEGGFSSKEFEQLNNHEGCHFVTLGPTILRAETAALAALAFFHCR